MTEVKLPAEIQALIDESDTTLKVFRHVNRIKEEILNLTNFVENLERDIVLIKKKISIFKPQITELNEQLQGLEK